jgi:protein-S-isoprenylcysteine O-methyltransferase Ste14
LAGRDYVQLAALGLFLAIVSYRAVRLRLREGASPVRLGLSGDGAVALALFGLTLAWAALVLAHALPVAVPLLDGLLAPSLPRWWLLECAGLILLGLAFGLFAWAMRDLGDSWRLGVDASAPARLVTSGAYAVTRNPIYVFFVVYYVATFLLNGSLVFLALAAIEALLLHRQVVVEERQLEAGFGALYRDYCSRTPRYWSWSALRKRVPAHAMEM